MDSSNGSQYRSRAEREFDGAYNDQSWALSIPRPRQNLTVAAMDTRHSRHSCTLLIRCSVAYPHVFEEAIAQYKKEFQLHRQRDYCCRMLLLQRWTLMYIINSLERWVVVSSRHPTSAQRGVPATDLERPQPGQISYASTSCASKDAPDVPTLTR